ncbi:MAG: heparinase II/III family protein [Planctomycetota bacterium]|nr:heparinase II/III family protein [Planctomycetota bacterium]
MKSKDYPDSICDISEKDFWSHIRAPARGEGIEHLTEAVRLGLTGRKDAAYKALAEYHCLALKDVWILERERIEREPPHPRQKAEDVLKLRITASHDHTVQFKSKIDWDCDEFGEIGKYGLLGLSWLTPAIRRFIERGEKRYGDCLIDIIDSYYAARNSVHPQRPVYYELGSWGKARNLLPLYLSLINTGEVVGRTVEAFVKLFLGFARSLKRCQKSCREGNWQIVGCSGLFRLARIFPEFSESRTWEKTALRYLREHLRKDFFSDGGHSDRCWGYGFMSLNGILDAYDMAQCRGGLGKDEGYFLRKIRSAFRWFARTLGRDELKPEYGDCKLGSGRGIIDKALRYFPKGAGRDLRIDRSRSYLLKPSGFAIMRNGGESDSAYLNITFGKFAGWHSHMDVLNLNFWALGQPLIEEAGRFDSYDNPLDTLIRTPEYHNVVTIGGQHFDCAVADDVRGRDVFWHSEPEIDYFSACHTAYKYYRLGSESANAIVRWTVVFIKDPGYAFVFDSVRRLASPEPAGMAITQNWHSPFPFAPVRPGLVRTKGRPAMLLALARTENLRRLETGVDFAGDEVTVKSTYSDRYHLRARRWMPIAEHDGVVGFATLLHPFKGATPNITVRPVEAKGAELFRAEAFEVRTPAGRDVFVLNPERLDGMVWKGRKFASRCLIELGQGHRKVVIG